MLPFRAQPINELRERYPHALNYVFDARGERARRLRPRPGDLYGHIFDCEDGLRLIISRERYDSPSDKICLHVSVSLRDKADLPQRMSTIDALAAWGVTRFLEISGDLKLMPFVGRSKAALHFIRVEEA